MPEKWFKRLIASYSILFSLLLLGGSASKEYRYGLGINAPLFTNHWIELK
jgi:hypothetical protein